MNRSYLLFITLVISVIFFLNSCKSQEKENNQANRECDELKLENEIQKYIIKDLLDTNISNTNLYQDYKMGVRLNKNACFTCNQSIVKLVKSNFNFKSICYVLYKKDSTLVDMLNLKRSEIIYSDSLFKFKSIDPVLFIKKDTSYLFKFSPDVEISQYTYDYIDATKKIIEYKKI